MSARSVIRCNMESNTIVINFELTEASAATNLPLFITINNDHINLHMRQ